jgi:hypothetical protein
MRGLSERWVGPLDAKRQCQNRLSMSPVISNPLVRETSDTASTYPGSSPSPPYYPSYTHRDMMQEGCGLRGFCFGHLGLIPDSKDNGVRLEWWAGRQPDMLATAKTPTNTGGTTEFHGALLGHSAAKSGNFCQ